MFLIAKQDFHQNKSDVNKIHFTIIKWQLKINMEENITFDIVA